MPKYSRSGESVRRAQRRSRRKHHVDTCRNEQQRCMQRTAFNSWIGETFFAQYDELTELSSQIAATLRISSSLQSKRKNTNGIVAGKTEEHAALTSSVQDNTTQPAQLASTSRVFWSRSLEAKNTKHSTAQKCKNSMKENEKGDRTTVVSGNSRCRTKKSVANQVEHI